MTTTTEFIVDLEKVHGPIARRNEFELDPETNPVDRYSTIKRPLRVRGYDPTIQGGWHNGHHMHGGLTYM